ncbi:MAG: triphosphoribosyl-dephospho-CoA synthase [Halapricum sp.]
MRTAAQNAELALLLEVAGTPKPGNVDRDREYDDLRFEHFLAGAVGAQDGLGAADRSDGPPIGEAFDRAVEGMSDQRGGNTQFGALLLLVPLVRAAARGDLSQSGAREVVEATTVTDAAGFYRAFEHVDVSVADPPESMEDLDVRQGSDAIPTLYAHERTLEDVMARSAAHDGVAREWTSGFERSFQAAKRLEAIEGPVTDRTARIFLELLADEPDTFVAINHDDEMAESVSERAQAALEGNEDVDELAAELIDREINPGTTADITAAGLFIALERGLAV